MGFSVLVNRLADPVHSGVVSNGIVCGIDHDDLVVFVGAVLANPVGVEDSEVAKSAASSHLGQSSEVLGGLDLVNTLALELSVDDALSSHDLAATSSDGNSVDAH